MYFICLGILFLSAGALNFEITLTRIFSVAQWYHFAFMAVSIALLGFGASGSFLSLSPGLVKKDLSIFLSLCALLFSLSVLVSYVVVNTLPFDSFRIGRENRQLLFLAVYYLSLSAPFFFTGLAVGAPLAKEPARANQVYCFNLAGSGLGCLLALVGPPFLGTGGTVLFVSLLGLVAMLLFSWRLYKVIALSAMGCGFVILFFLFDVPASLEVRMSPYKSLSQTLRQQGAKSLWTKSNAFSRLDVIESKGLHIAPGLSFSYGGALPHQIGVAVDGENVSPISEVEPEKASFTEYLPTSLVYQLFSDPQVLVLEPQGGLDVLAALHHHASHVTAIFGNPLLVEALRDRFGTEASHILSHPCVSVVVDGPRSYLRRSEEEFDIIQVSLTDSFRAVSAGAYSLSENYVYTVEAFEEYYRHLAPQGVLSITRWVQVPPSEEIRILSIAVTALERLGVDSPETHLAAIRSFQTITLLVKKGNLNDHEIADISRFCQDNMFDVVYFPGISPSDVNLYNVLPREFYYEAFLKILSASERERFYHDHLYDVSPTFDVRPFFFHFFKWGQTSQILRSLGKSWQPFGGAGFLVIFGLLALALVASLAFILFPLLFRLKAQRGLREVVFRRGVRWQTFGYFSALGIGYLFIEIPLMQRFILFLNQPTYAFAIVLFTILTFSAIGSLLSNRLEKVFMPIFFVLVVLTFVYPLLLSSLFEALLGETLPLRLLVSVGALAPLSFLMGIPFPSGVRMVGTIAPDLVPWAWAINGCVSVISSILAMVIALSWGFSWVLVGAGVAYAVGLGVIYPWERMLKMEALH